jgi:hypothetical protein
MTVTSRRKTSLPLIVVLVASSLYMCIAKRDIAGNKECQKGNTKDTPALDARGLRCPHSTFGRKKRKRKTEAE